MNLLQKHFDTALESPDGIKKLRELILTLAMQGKLVKQDPKDQPASELFKEIQSEKAQLIKEGKIKKQKELPPIKPEEVPYEVPKGWEWVRLGNIGIINPRNEVLEDSLLAGFVPMPLISEGMVNLHSFEERPWSEIKKGYTHFADGDVGMAKITPCFENAKSCVFRGLPNGIGAGTTELHIFRNTFNSIVPVFLLFYLKNPRFLAFAETKMTGSAGQKRVPTPIFTELLFPLPPLAEQKRIVAKIDELMALCDKLEAQRNACNEKQMTVHTAAINRLLTASCKNDFYSAWKFITRHFDPLYSVKENVTELKKAILTLAMQGKLVKQDPNDQPASELLKEIQAEKERLIKEGKIKKQKEVLPIKPDEIPYEVPKGWVWTRLGEISSIQTGKKDVNEGHENGKYPFFSCAQIPLKSNEYSYDTEALLLPGNGANVGQVTYYHGKFEAYQRTYILSDFFPDTIIFVQKILEARFLKSLEGKQYGSAINYIKLGSLTDFLVPLPPLAEQKRIVAKIGELMTLCDKLETQLDQATAKQTSLFDAVLAQVH